MRALFSILFILLIPGYSISFFDLFRRDGFPSNEFVHFMIGFFIFIPLWFIFARRATFLLVFEHELTHMLTGMLFLKSPSSFRASESRGGEVYLKGSNFVITLSPYFLPTFSFLLMPFYAIIKTDYIPYLNVIIGSVTSFHILSTIKETSFAQDDIRRYGALFSLLVIIFFSIIFYGFLLYFVEDGFMDGGVKFLMDGISRSVELSKSIITKI